MVTWVDRQTTARMRREDLARKTVNVHNERELRLWAAELHVTQADLEELVHKVGIQLSAIRRELARR